MMAMPTEGIDTDSRHWEIVRTVERSCKRAFMCDSIALHSDGTFTAMIYADYYDPRYLIKKFEKAGGQVLDISHKGWNWYYFKFKVLP